MEIIIASNNLFRRELSSFILSEAGYVVHEVNDEITLRYCLEQNKPDLVLLDDPMPGIDSTDIASYIHQKQAVPVMFITSGFTNHFAQPNLGMRQADDYLLWPYQPEDLLKHVNALLSRSTKNKTLQAA